MELGQCVNCNSCRTCQGEAQCVRAENLIGLGAGGSACRMSGRSVIVVAWSKVMAMVKGEVEELKKYLQSRNDRNFKIDF